ncbi:hypothetical protein HYPSUDRAFT_68376 [Hypholoma sublateritium FD-334 SS-4]|uniref:DUF5648 domain-containing protein n=1 Tax=Hypholoma sublateritium (strain FD-334 SS-4) TaxID=945553 RepID=A0A0D2NVX2_HYPSF|nr:hypothetical protein HYPSUDRAFT_68376 [Hypholoma sublateritium FD-334 SS-4]
MQNIFTILVAFLLSYISATCTTTMEEYSSREAETCADPSLATLYIAAFSPTRIAHLIRTPAVMVSTDTLNGNTDNWQFQGPSFLAWLSPQEFTVPFYQLAANNGDDFLFLPAVNGTPPTVAGFTNQAIVGYAYSTQVCGSVPLLAASNAGATDHWWTTSQSSHDELLASELGWVDAGIPFYVLPLGMPFRS